MFVAVVSDKQLRFAAMASPASISPTCAAWLNAARVVARAAEAGARTYLRTTAVLDASGMQTCIAMTLVPRLASSSVVRGLDKVGRH